MAFTIISTNTDLTAAAASLASNDGWIVDESVFVTTSNGAVMVSSGTNTVVEIDGSIVASDTAPSSTSFSMGGSGVFTIGVQGSLTTTAQLSFALTFFGAYDITNAGTISAGTGGLTFNGTASGSFTNIGTLSAGATAIFVSSSATTDIFNLGLISATSGILSNGNSTIENSGTIQADQIGVSAEKGAVLNSGTISGFVAVDLNRTNLVDTVLLVNSGDLVGRETAVKMDTGSLGNSGTITGASGISGVNVDITNTGSIIGTNSNAISLVDGNSSVVNNSGKITAAAQGIFVSNNLAAGTVKITNSGSIEAVFGISSNQSVVLDNSGTITGIDIGLNLASGDIRNIGAISGKTGIETTASLFLVNEGDILGGPGGFAVKAVNTSANSAVTNSGTISGASDAILLAGPLASVENNGTIQAGGKAVQLTSGGTMINSGAIQGGIAVDLNAVSNTVLTRVDNTGTIAGITAGILMVDGSINNDGTISGAQAVQGRSVDVSNSGTITSGTADAILLSGSGSSVTNSGSLVGFDRAIQVTTSAGAQTEIINSGEITAFVGVDTAGTASVVNSGEITALSIGVRIALGEVRNSGLISGDTGVSSSGQVTVANEGVIMGNLPGGAGISSTGNASKVNNLGQIISDGFGIQLLGAGVGVTNSGTIQSFSGTGVLMSGGGVLINTGLISSRNAAVSMSSVADTVFNSGTVQGLISLGAGNDTYDGTGGKVTGGVVDGGAGDDTFIVTFGPTILAEAVGGGADKVLAGVDFALATGMEIETLILTDAAVRGTGNEIANTVTGNVLDNVLAGLEGNDTVSGGVGLDLVKGGTGNDSLLGGADEDVLKGGVDNDSLEGGADEDVLKGGAGDDSLLGGTEDDLLQAGDGNDTMSGGDGNDTIMAGTGRDTMNGNNGDDVFIFKTAAEIGLVTAATNDFVNGFVSGQDKLDFSGIDAIASTAKNDEFTFIGTGAFTNVAGQLRIAVVGANLNVEGDVNGDGIADFQLRLTGVTTISAGDLVL